MADRDDRIDGLAEKLGGLDDDALEVIERVVDRLLLAEPQDDAPSDLSAN